MTKTTIACIGSGNMGSALMKGIVCGSRTPCAISIGFADADKQKAIAAASAISTTEFSAQVYASNIEAVESSEYVFLAVKPQVLGNVLAEIAPAVRKRQAAGNAPTLVSMAAGWRIRQIQIAIDSASALPVVRIMPNTPALVSKGIIPLAPSLEVPAEKTAKLEALLGGAGTVDIGSEQYLESATGVSGCGPAFAYMFIEALADGGVFSGMPRDKAFLHAASAVLGAAAMVLETGKHPGELKDMVCSPGGATIAGVAALEENAFRSAAIKAVVAASQRALELSGEPPFN